MNKTYGGLVSQPRNSRGTTVIGTSVTHTFSGEVVETITIPEEYVVHDVIAPEGDVQVFKDQQCTEYATGAEQTVYVRLNTAVGFGEGFTVGGGSVQGDHFSVTAPSEGHDDDPYYVQVWDMWGSDDFAEAFTEGQVIECTNTDPDFEPVENPTTIFSKPEPPTPVDPVELFNRTDSSSGNTYLVDSRGSLVYLDENSQPYVFQLDSQTGNYNNPVMRQLPYLVQAWGMSKIGDWTHGQTTVVTVNGVAYTFTASGNNYTIAPAAGTYGQ